MDTSRRGRFLSEILHDDQLTVSCQIVVVMETQNRLGVVNRLKVIVVVVVNRLKVIVVVNRLQVIDVVVVNRLKVIADSITEGAKI